MFLGHFSLHFNPFNPEWPESNIIKLLVHDSFRVVMPGNFRRITLENAKITKSHSLVGDH